MCFRFTFPFIIQVARDIEYKDIENLVLQRLSAKTKLIDTELVSFYIENINLYRWSLLAGIFPYQTKPSP